MSAALKLFVFGALIVRLAVPVSTGYALLDWPILVVGMLGVSVVIGIVESVRPGMGLVNWYAMPPIRPISEITKLCIAKRLRKSSSTATRGSTASSRRRITAWTGAWLLDRSGITYR